MVDLVRLVGCISFTTFRYLFIAHIMQFIKLQESRTAIPIFHFTKALVGYLASIVAIGITHFLGALCHVPVYDEEGSDSVM